MEKVLFLHFNPLAVMMAFVFIRMLCIDRYYIILLTIYEKIKQRPKNYIHLSTFLGLEWAQGQLRGKPLNKLMYVIDIMNTTNAIGN